MGPSPGTVKLHEGLFPALIWVPSARPSLSPRLRLVASVSPNRRPRPLGTTEGRLWHYGLDAVVGNSQADHTDLDK